MPCSNRARDDLRWGADSAVGPRGHRTRGTPDQARVLGNFGESLLPKKWPTPYNPPRAGLLRPVHSDLLWIVYNPLLPPSEGTSSQVISTRHSFP